MRHTWHQGVTLYIAGIIAIINFFLIQISGFWGWVMAAQKYHIKAEWSQLLCTLESQRDILEITYI